MTFTIDQLKAIGARCKAPLLELYTPRINEAMAEFEITTPMRAAAFIAQLFHESGGLIYMEEIASGAAYDNRKDLGNTRPEAIAAAKARGTSPGRLFKGRGPIQLTGFDNYKIYGAKLGLDLIAAPELAASPGSIGIAMPSTCSPTRGCSRPSPGASTVASTATRIASSIMAGPSVSSESSKLHG
jgi:predicted chitinase